MIRKRTDVNPGGCRKSRREQLEHLTGAELVQAVLIRMDRKVQVLQLDTDSPRVSADMCELAALIRILAKANGVKLNACTTTSRDV